MGLTSEEVTILVLCVVIFVVACLIVFVWCCCRQFIFTNTTNSVQGDQQVMQSLVFVSPPSGTYNGPLTIEVFPRNVQHYATLDVYVKVIHESSVLFGNNHTATFAGMNGTNGFGAEDEMTRVMHGEEERLKEVLMGYLLYTQPLHLERPGNYVVKLYCRTKNRGLGEAKDFIDAQQHYFTVMGEEGGDTTITIPDTVFPSPPRRPVMPIRPPRVVPDSGEVTDNTQVKIVLVGGLSSPTLYSPNASTLTLGGGGHTGTEYILYSIDNSFPSVVYTGPFTLTIPQGRNSARYTIRAVATDGQRASEVTTATLDVLKHDTVTYDSAIPAPTAQVEAIGAMLYFESPVEPDAIIYYQLEFEGERPSLNVEGSPRSHLYAVDDASGPDYFEGIKGKERLVYQNKAIEVPTDVRRIYAWTVPRGGYATAGEGKPPKESRPAIYDVCLQRLVPHPKLGKSTTRRYNPPVMCVRCSDLYLTFDEPPASYRLLYTLDGTEPSATEDCTSTRQFRAGARPIDISKCAEGSVTVTARYFTHADERGLTRFGDRFSRGFHFGA